MRTTDLFTAFLGVALINAYCINPNRAAIPGRLGVAQSSQCSIQVLGYHDSSSADLDEFGLVCIPHAYDGATESTF